MSSVVYYKFKSQKEPSRVTFDGTGISVFDLKREILLANKLSATADSFDLHIINPDTKEEYNDDTEVIPRSMSVIARRLPLARPGSKDNAAKYVNGSMTIGSSKNTSRREDVRIAANKSATYTPPTNIAAASGTGNSEEDNIAAMFQAQGQQWQQTQEEMSTKAPVYYNSNAKGGFQGQVPDQPPPPGYLCYRCGQKGHWIQACPTNNDPNWEGKRVRRTTGIPRSMLRTVAKPPDDEAGNYMINDEGEYVVAIADKKSWELYQDKQKNQSKDGKPTDPELECPLTHRLFVKPVKTPCCKTTYSEDAIQQALLDSDFICPKCKTEEVLLDQLTPDVEMEERVRKYKQGDKVEDDGGDSSDVKNEKEDDNEIINDDGNDQYKSMNKIKEESKKSPPATSSISNSRKRSSKRRRDSSTERSDSDRGSDRDASKRLKEGSSEIEEVNRDSPSIPPPPVPGQFPPWMMMMPGMPPMPPMPGMPGMPPMPGMPGMPPGMPFMPPMPGMPFMPGMPGMPGISPMPNMPLGSIPGFGNWDNSNQNANNNGSHTPNNSDMNSSNDHNNNNRKRRNPRPSEYQVL